MKQSRIRLGRAPGVWPISIGADVATGEEITLFVALSRDGRYGPESTTPPPCPICGYDADEDQDRGRGRSFDPPRPYAGTGPIPRSWSMSDFGQDAERHAPSGCGRAHRLQQDLKALTDAGSWAHTGADEAAGKGGTS